MDLVKLAKPRTERHQKFADTLFSLQSQYLRARYENISEQEILDRLLPIRSILIDRMDKFRESIVDVERDKEHIERFNELKKDLANFEKTSENKATSDGINKIGVLLQILGKAYIIEDDYNLIDIDSLIMNHRKIIRACIDTSKPTDVDRIRKAFNVISVDMKKKMSARSEALVAKRSAQELKAFCRENDEIISVLIALIDRKFTGDSSQSLDQSIVNVTRNAIENIYKLFMWLHVYIDESDEWAEVDAKCNLLLSINKIWPYNQFKIPEIEAQYVFAIISELRADIERAIPGVENATFLRRLDSQILPEFKGLFPSNVSLKKVEYEHLKKEDNGFKGAVIIGHEIDRTKFTNFTKSVEKFYDSYKAFMHEKELKAISERNKDDSQDFQDPIKTFIELSESSKKSDYYKDNEKRIKDLVNKINQLRSKSNLSEEEKLELKKAENELNIILYDLALNKRNDTVASLHRQISTSLNSRAFDTDFPRAFARNLTDFVDNEHQLQNLQNQSKTLVDLEDAKKASKELHKVLDRGHAMDGALTRFIAVQSALMKSQQRDPSGNADESQLGSGSSNFESASNALKSVQNSSSEFSKQLENYLLQQQGMDDAIHRGYDEINCKIDKEKQEILEGKKSIYNKNNAIGDNKEDDDLDNSREGFKKTDKIMSAEEIYKSEKLDFDQEIDRLPDQGAIIDTTRNLHSKARSYESNDNPIIIAVKSIITHLVKAQRCMDVKDKKGLLGISVALVELCGKLQKDCSELSRTPGLRPIQVSDLQGYSESSLNDCQQLRILVTLKCNEFMEGMSALHSVTNDSFNNLLIICNRITSNVNKALTASENSALAATNAKFPFEKRNFTRKSRYNK